MKATEGNEQLKQVLGLSGKLGSAKEFTKHHDGDNHWILPGAFSWKKRLETPGQMDSSHQGDSMYNLLDEKLYHSYTENLL